MEFLIGLNYSSLNGKVLKKADTSADVNTLNETTFKELFLRFPIDMLQPNNIELKIMETAVSPFNLGNWIWAATWPNPPAKQHGRLWG